MDDVETPRSAQKDDNSFLRFDLSSQYPFGRRLFGNRRICLGLVASFGSSCSGYASSFSLPCMRMPAPLCQRHVLLLWLGRPCCCMRHSGVGRMNAEEGLADAEHAAQDATSHNVVDRERRGIVIVSALCLDGTEEAIEI